MMSGMVIQQTDSSPFIEISANGANLLLKGNSFVPDPRDFYKTLLAWARDFKAGHEKKLAVEITPGYYSTSNIQVFNLLLKTLTENNPGQIGISFYVEQDEAEDMQETIYSLVFNTGLEPEIIYIGE